MNSEVRPTWYYSCAQCERNFITEEDHYEELIEAIRHLCLDCRRMVEVSDERP